MSALTEEYRRSATDTTAGFTTTLYDLVAALQEVVEPENDMCIIATIAYWLQSQRITFLGNTTDIDYELCNGSLRSPTPSTMTGMLTTEQQ
jgi:hypothetical protein